MKNFSQSKEDLEQQTAQKIKLYGIHRESAHQKLLPGLKIGKQNSEKMGLFSDEIKIRGITTEEQRDLQDETQ